MDNLGDWLYVIVAIVAGISGIVSSTRKKKRLEEVLGPPLPPEEDWLPRPEPEQAPPPKKPEAKVKKPELYKASAIVEQDYFPPDIQIDNPFGISLEELQDGDGVKKAIIYSEILNRKY